ncbi:PD-(D/E)XK nuclease family protein [Pseudobacillus sp. FSL P4-0506]|uniref:PD-(D/E)XK nuclease family protein n=1 Tax=Pseudobacillus sp. FSL P4-0506 TaxID=2921576 RepID=UPI0030FD1547
MKSRYPLVSLKTMANYHLESFIRCPYTYYYQHVLLLNPLDVKWRQVIQSIINQVVQNFYQLPLDAQNKLNILKLIHRYWKSVSPQLFESKVHYYMVLTKTTDHLLQFLSAKKEQKPPLWVNTNIEELEAQLSLTIELEERATHSFTIKKFLLEADEEIIQLYNDLTIVFSNKAFGKLPERIEISTLLEGEKYTFSPTVNNAAEGNVDVKNMKDLLQHPNDYTKISSLRECRKYLFLHKRKGSPNSLKVANRPNEDY